MQRCEVLRISHKNLAIGTILVLTLFLSLIAFVATSYATLQAINPLAAVTAVAIALIGMVWFKRTNR